MIGTGRRPFPSLESLDLSYHRNLATDALKSRAHRDDEERRLLEKQLEEIDRAIERGVDAMPDDARREFLMGLYGARATESRHEQAADADPSTVEAIMTHRMVTLNEEDNLADLEPSMAQFGLRHLPVVDGTRLVGLVSHRDVLRVQGSEIASSPLGAQVDKGTRDKTFVAEVMHRDLVTVSPTTPAIEAAKILADHKFGCLPVVDGDGNLVGIVTDHDLLVYFISQG